ncbi:hypothetical protein [Butyricimonas virosa]|uniref:hypothetical protein n=1 Tax=Butyricimonas virosa TaxID=544645 RepID=UPI00242EEF9C|nr:hypothetical protein [Butyricimonas virosa]MDY5489700.1 hypothetical protein [Butyricimonas virosa]
MTQVCERDPDVGGVNGEPCGDVGRCVAREVDGATKHGRVQAGRASGAKVGCGGSSARGSMSVGIARRGRWGSRCCHGVPGCEGEYLT